MKRHGLLFLVAVVILAGCSGEDDGANRPDPAVRGITVDPLQPEAGVQFRIKAQLENMTENYAERVTWRLRKDGLTQLTGTITGFEGREIMTLDVPINATAGTYTYAFQLNWDSALDEVDAGNNVGLVTIVVQPSGNG